MSYVLFSHFSASSYLINVASLSKVSKAHGWKVPVSFYGRFPLAWLLYFPFYYRYCAFRARSPDCNNRRIHVLRIEESGLRQVFADFAVDQLSKKMRRRAVAFTRYIIPGMDPTFFLLSTWNLRITSRVCFFILLLSFTIYYVIVIINFTRYIVTRYRLLSLLRLLL